MKLMDDMEFDNSFSLHLQPAPRHPAANLADDTPHDVKLRRLQEVQANINANITRISESLRGSTQRLLVERGRSNATPENSWAAPECNRVVNFAAPERLIGQMVDVRSPIPAPTHYAARC